MTAQSESQELILRGLPISKGIAIGSPFFFSSVEDPVAEMPIASKEVEEEVGRYRKALDQSREDLEKLRTLSLHEGPPEIVAILGTHLEMMQDPMMTTVIEDKIRTQQKNTESIFQHMIEEYKKRFSTLQDTYFQERVRDIIDVSRRILGHLRPLSKVSAENMPQNSIGLANELVPSEAIEASVTAFVTASGGITSHTAIIARAKGIPYVANIDIKLFRRLQPQSLIVDGAQGIVILNPSAKTLKKYRGIQKSQDREYRQMRRASQLKGETIDGYEVKIFGNLENPKEVDLLLKNRASGVGLFRSEYLFLAKRTFPSEEEQFEIYKGMARALKKRPLVVRVYDIGGDKKTEVSPGHRDAQYFSKIGAEMNPSLGCRAVRFLLRFPELLEIQLRAILRASAYGEIHILVPMISDIGEMQEVRQMVERIKGELKAKKIRFAKEIPIGCMIEVPSSAIMCDALAKEADFLSIGTNDLVQYVMAADRSNPHTHELYFSMHPSILRLIRMVVASASAEKKPLIVCGECAADPTLIPILLGLGIRNFSVSARHIPPFIDTIRKWRILEACRVAEGALEHGSAGALKQYLAEETVR
jgi:phosphotransferase system enzyme I (PtsI)